MAVYSDLQRKVRLDVPPPQAHETRASRQRSTTSCRVCRHRRRVLHAGVAVFIIDQTQSIAQTTHTLLVVAVGFTVLSRSSTAVRVQMGHLAQ